MKDSLFWRALALLLVIALFRLAGPAGPNDNHPFPSLLSQAHAGVGAADEDTETLFTASADGKRIYMWQYFSSKPPKFLGEAQAILSQ